MTDEEIRQQIIDKRKKSTKKRLVALAAVVALTVTAGYFTGSAIGNRRYEKEMNRFVSVVSDDPLVNVAMNELGNRGGEKFWAWYGFEDRVEWCAIFASWCEDQCGFIDEGKAPSFSLVSDGSDWFIERGLSFDPDKVPEAGDLIFFDWEQDGDRDHVGIVTGVADNKVFTVEGNSSDLCRQKRYSLDDPVIYGYGMIEE